jgi:predicted enzyme related to lactoylglutathione lyase
MLNDSEAFAGLSVDDIQRAKSFYPGVRPIAWFTDPAGNILSVVEQGDWSPARSR